MRARIAWAGASCFLSILPGCSSAAPVTGATVSLNAIHTCNRNCESALDRCAASAGCRLGTYKRAGDDGQFGFGDTNTVTYSCSNDPAMAAPARKRTL